MRSAIRFMGLSILLILLWQGGVALFHIPNYMLPAPRSVVAALLKNYRFILQQSTVTMVEILVGFIFGCAFGMWAALVICYSRLARIWFLPLLIISQALPTFAIAPLIVLWLGYGMASKIAITVIMIFFPVTSAFYDGLNNTPTGYLEMAHTMNATPGQLLWRIKVPAALPRLASGLRMAAVFAPMGAVIGEWVGSSKGLGFLMITANARLQTALMFAALFVLVVMTLLLYYGVDLILRRLITWV